MRVEEAIAFVVEREPAGLEIRVNFGVFAGRDATTAELEELGKLLVPEAGEGSIVGEERHELSEDAGIVLHQVRVAVPIEAVPGGPPEPPGVLRRAPPPPPGAGRARLHQR